MCIQVRHIGTHCACKLDLCMVRILAIRGYTHRDIRVHKAYMTESTEYATPPKSTKSRNSNSSVQIQIKQKSQFELVPRDTEKSEFLNVVDGGGGAFSMKLLGLFPLKRGKNDVRALASSFGKSFRKYLFKWDRLHYTWG